MYEEQNQSKGERSLDPEESAGVSTVECNNQFGIMSKWIEDGKICARDAVQCLPLHEGIVGIVDFGCSDGTNSISVMNQLLNEIQNRQDYISNLKITMVYHQDLPNASFDAIKNYIGNPEIGYPFHNLIKSNNIQVNSQYIGKTYYQQIVESNSIDIAFCYTSLYWMSEVHPKDYAFTYAPEYGDQYLTQWFGDLSDRALTRWLNLRHEELKSSGLLCFSIMTHLSCVKSVNQCWGQIFKRSPIGDKGYIEINVPIYNRSLGRVTNILKRFQSKFQVINYYTVKDRLNLSKEAIQPALYNHIVVGLAQYLDQYKDESITLPNYDQFEKMWYQENNQFSLQTQFEWILLKKR